MADVEGGCQCGAVHYAVAGQPVVTALCHCTSCRHAHAAPVVAWAMFREAQLSYGKAAPTAYESSPGVKRWFCSACGTQLAYTAGALPGFVDVAIGSLDRPDLMPPALHIWDAERLPWMKLADGLPVHAGFPPGPV